MTTTPSNWRYVFMCTVCTYKYQDKPEFCTAKEGECKNTEFSQVKVYCLDKILSFGCFINCIVGGRRLGKTYSVAQYCVNKYLKNKTKFVWIRRYKTETKSAVKSFGKLGYFFNNNMVYYESEIETVTKKGAISHKKVRHEIGRVITLSTASRIRGDEFNDFETMVVDEYGDETGIKLKEEFTAFNSLITSIIDEKKYGIVFVLSNNVNRFLPIYENIGVRWDEEWTFNWQKSAVCHVIVDNQRKWTGASAKWLESTDYFEYAVHNKPLDYDKDLIEKHELEFLTGELCFKLSNLKQNVTLIKWNDYYVLDFCKNCKHDFKIIDLENALNFVKNEDVNVQHYILDIFLAKKMRYTNPIIKEKMLHWVGAHLVMV